MEEFGGSGTAGSHWESRMVYNDLMAGYAMEDTKISRITLALLEDMGWYRPTYLAQQFLEYGYK